MARSDDVFTTTIPIPEEHEQSPAFRLFYKRYQIRVAKIHTESATYIELRGAEGNEYQGNGRANAQQLITTMATPATMVSLFGEGATVHLVDPRNAMPIYNDIVAHLKDWKDYLERKVHGRYVPEEDLLLFDAFAAAIFPYARHDIMTTGADLLLSGVAGIRPRSRLRTGGISRFTAEENQHRETMARGTSELPEQHTPMGDALAHVPSGRKSKWT